jgi:Na+-transporting NADH:ubiquinone oxidoreductase subunit NqrD
MKTNILSLSSALAASAALITAIVGGVAFTVVGVLAIFALDYRRTLAPVSLPADVVPFNPTGRSMPEMRLAA